MKQCNLFHRNRSSKSKTIAQTILVIAVSK